MDGLRFITMHGWTKARMIEQIRAKNNGSRSVNKEGCCLYRAEDGNACAVGCFIPDELYDPSFEIDLGVEKLMDSPAIADVMPLSEYGMFCLQTIHDDYGSYDHVKYMSGAQDHKKHKDVRDALVAWIEESVIDST